MKATRILIVAAVVAVLAPVAAADWVTGMPAKWVQMPDLTSTGMDVNATYAMPAVGGPGQFPFIKVLADDFLCTSTGPITDIHIWGSWLNDNINTNAQFSLSIHSDVPAGPNVPYSHPGDLLWQQTFVPGKYVVRPWAEAPEQFYEPNTGQIIGRDTQVLQYNFDIPAAVAFVQKGTETNSQVYWLDVQALSGPDQIFGWKTSQQHWNDDAVYGDTQTFGGPPIGGTAPPWRELIYPAGQSLDMSFVITPEPATLTLMGLGVAGLIARRRRSKK